MFVITATYDVALQQTIDIVINFSKVTECCYFCCSYSSGASTGSAHSHTRHTRHLSLIGGQEGIKNGHRKKRVSRRQGSIKLRSRSPPELPPPPPPELNGDVPASPSSLVPQGNTTDQTHLSEPGGLQRNEESTVSLGFSGVMDAISNIEHELDVMSDEFSPKPTFPAPQRPSPNEGSTFKYSDVRTPSPVQEYPEMEREERMTHGDNFNEEEWLCDVSSEPNSLDDHFSEQSVDRALGPSPKVIEDHVHHNVLASPENAHVATISPANQEKAPRRSKQVMFKDEVEDIPNTYEPCADHHSRDDDDEDIPSSVAELKKRLFGAREGEAARYKKDGVLSPKYTHPENMTFEPGYHFHDDRERSPNVNNNNSGGESEQVYDDDHHGDADEHNLYDEPWEKRSTSKFKVLQAPKKSSQHQKELTPPPVAPKPTTPPPKEKTPPPGTENGGIMSQSLDRYSYSTERSKSMGNESLLSSISHTLQERSRYGSDSFLNNFEPSSPTKKKAEVKFSSRGELEKIRAAHRREPPAPPSQGTSPLAQGASPPVHKGNSPNHQRHNGHPVAFSKRSFGEFGGPPRMAASLDALRDTKPNTQVTYDINTNSHTYRSLV